MIHRLEAWLVRRLLPRRMLVESLSRQAGGRFLLTFDDGPLPETTPAVLDILAGRGIRALFFAVGERVARHPDLARRIVAEGHRLESHSWDHRPGRLLDVNREREQLRRFLDLVRQLDLPAPRFHRPPAGRLSIAAARACHEQGLRVMLWSREARDWAIRAEDEARTAGARLAAAVRPGDIVLMHDGAPRAPAFVASFLEALEGIPGAPLPADPGFEP